MEHKSQIQHRIRDELAKSYPGIFNFDRKTVAKIVGCTPGHLANLETRGCPLIISVKVGAKPLYQLPDIIDFLARQRATPSTPRRRGPRTKAERMLADGGAK